MVAVSMNSNHFDSMAEAALLTPNQAHIIFAGNTDQQRFKMPEIHFFYFYVKDL